MMPPTVHAFPLHLIEAIILVDVENEVKFWSLLVANLVTVVDKVSYVGSAWIRTLEKVNFTLAHRDWLERPGLLADLRVAFGTL